MSEVNPIEAARPMTLEERAKAILIAHDCPPGHRAIAAILQMAEERDAIAADTLKRYREALTVMNAHVEAMQNAMVSYLMPSGDDRETFVQKMLYMLDGPEQRTVQDQVRQALSDS